MNQSPPVLTHLLSAQVTEAATDYAERYTTPRSPAVASLAEDSLRILPVKQMVGGAVEGRFLSGLVAITGASRILEVGTLTGVTALTLAEALPDGGQLTTIERDAKSAAMARRYLDASPHGDKVQLIVGDAREVLQELTGPYDLVFLDALKAQYVEYYEAVVPMLSERGVIIADNVLWWGLPFHEEAVDDETQGVRRFVAHVQADPRTCNALLTVADGLLMIWRASGAAQPGR
ncbi:MAG: O-methyltransferase [Solirubrobacterales bacterium]|nr:O-methyltransferase [Solirubrobacterales bacterium]